MSKLDDLIKELCPNGVEYKKTNSFCEIKTGKGITSKDSSENGEYPIISGGKTPMGYYDKYNREGNTVTISRVGANAGFVLFLEEKFYLNDKCFSVIPFEEYKNTIIPKYLYYFFKNIENQIVALQSEGGVPTINTQKVGNLEIPVPPLPVQEEIVRILDTFTSLTAELTAELTARRKQYEYYRDSLLTRETKVEVKKLGDIADIGVGNKPRQILEEKTEYEYINAGTTNSGYTSITNCEGDTVTTPSRGQGGIGFVGYQKNDFYLGPLCYKIRSFNTKLVMNKYLFYYLQNNNEKILKIKNTGGVPSVNRADLINISISFPPLDVQQRIVNVLDNFDAICTDLKIGLPAEIEARKKQYEYYRDMLLSFDTIHTNGGGRAEAMR